MKKVTLITGNSGKATYFEQYLDYPFEHQKVELPEIQSLDVIEVAADKARRAYEKIKRPVLVDDIALSFKAFGGKLPGTLIKWFLEEIEPEGLCLMLDGYDDRRAVARACMAYYDGQTLKTFSGKVQGSIAQKPRPGKRGYGWDVIFIPDGSNKTYSEMSEGEIKKFGVRPLHIFEPLKDFLKTIDNN